MAQDWPAAVTLLLDGCGKLGRPEMARVCPLDGFICNHMIRPFTARPSASTNATLNVSTSSQHYSVRCAFISILLYIHHLVAASDRTCSEQPDTDRAMTL